MGFKKSFIHFIYLLKERNFEDIRRISRYYYLDKFLRKICIFKIRLGSKLNPPKKLHTCPSCGKSFPYFYPIVAGDSISYNVQCPHCNSYERHRAQWLYYTKETTIFTSEKPVAILHCAPEKLFFTQFYENPNVDYYPVDKWEGYTVCGKKMRDYVDITKLPYAEDMFDYILCNHVLEHIEDEQAALFELKRVLKPDGYAFLNVPIDPSMEETLENPAYNTYALRLKYYGQCDHVRKYGLDYQKRLEKAGFIVTCIVVNEYFTPQQIEQYGLLANDRLYFCQKKNK